MITKIKSKKNLEKRKRCNVWQRVSHASSNQSNYEYIFKPFAIMMRDDLYPVSEYFLSDDPTYDDGRISFLFLI
jgi:hypothetical protein